MNFEYLDNKYYVFTVFEMYTFKNKLMLEI